MSLDDVGKSLDDAATGFKQVQIIMMVFCGLVTIGIILIAITLIRE